MRAFEVHLNGKKLCSAGVGSDGVLTAIVTCVQGKKASDVFLTVGGLVSRTEEHVSWVRQRPLRVGDKIQVKIVKAASVDPPTARYQMDRQAQVRYQKSYVRKLAKQLGWTIQPKTKRPRTK
jgi:hypothetical protein